MGNSHQKIRKNKHTYILSARELIFLIIVFIGKASISSKDKGITSDQFLELTVPGKLIRNSQRLLSFRQSMEIQSWRGWMLKIEAVLQAFSMAMRIRSERQAFSMATRLRPEESVFCFVSGFR